MRLAIVTGGSRGLGAALCERYRMDGWTVIEFSRSAPSEYGVRLDMADAFKAGCVFEKRLAALRALTPDEVVAFGNAGVVEPVGPVERFSVEAVVANLNTNISSAILFARAFVAAFQDLEAPKTFVNVSSGAAARGTAGWSLYCAGKAAMENYVRAVALEQAERPAPIRFISVNPGVMDTAMQETVRASARSVFPAVERYVRLHDEGRLAPPSFTAARIAALVASRPEAASVTAVR